MQYKKREEFLVYGAPVLGEEEIEGIVSVLRSGWIGTGPRVEEFEKAFSAYKDITSATAVASCTAALHLSLLVSDLKPGDEVITTSMTFCATINAIIHAGGKPVVVDIDPITGNIDPDLVEKAITPRTRIILPVHYAGYPCDMDALLQISEKNSLLIIEDCAHAIETEYKGRKAGTFGDFGCFSFYVTKNLVTGEGGMVITNDARKAERIRVLALHGITKDAWTRFSDDGYKHYQVVEAGYKYNMTDMQAELGLHQLTRLDKNWIRRKEIWDKYRTELAVLSIGLPREAGKSMRHGYHLFPITIKKKIAGITRDQFLEEITTRNIGAGVHYLSIPEYPYYQHQYGWNPDDYPNARDFGRSTLSLPLSAKLTNKDVDDVIEAVQDVLDNV